MFLLHLGTGPTVLIRKSRTLSVNAEQDLSLLNQALSIVLYSRGSQTTFTNVAPEGYLSLAKHSLSPTKKHLERKIHEN